MKTARGSRPSISSRSARSSPPCSERNSSIPNLFNAGCQSSCSADSSCPAHTPRRVHRRATGAVCGPHGTNLYDGDESDQRLRHGTEAPNLPKLSAGRPARIPAEISKAASVSYYQALEVSFDRRVDVRCGDLLPATGIPPGQRVLTWLRLHPAGRARRVHQMALYKRMLT
jgi:hypothetical protein